MLKIFHQDEFGTLYYGDSKEVLSQLPNQSIQSVITSPPYWAQRDYGEDGQLGQEPSFKNYVENLASYFDVTKNVLKDNGTLWINIDDTYYGSNKGSGGKTVKQLTNKGSFFTPNKGNKGSNLENAKEFSKNKEARRKSLCLIPQRLAIKLTDDYKWILRNELIWHKPNAMTESARDRFTRDFEEFFLFTKNEKYFFNQQFEPFVWNETKPRKDGNSDWDNNTKQKTHRARKMQPNDKGRNKRSIWSINTQPIYGLNHFAKFPEKLLITPILASTNEGDAILDPFFGAGTTAIVAEKLNRKWVGIELNESYCYQAMERVIKERNARGKQNT